MIFSYLNINKWLCPQLGGGGGGGGSTTTQEIPAELKPLAKRYTSEAIGIADKGYVPYGGERYADLDPLQMQGVQGIADRAQQGSAYTDASRQALTDTASGQFLNPDSNPYLRGMVDRAQDDVMTRVNMMDRGSGSYGNSGIQQAATRELADVTNDIYGQNYMNERQNMMQAGMYSPQFAQADYMDANQMLNAGQILQDQEQQGMDFQYQQFEDEQNLPYKNLAAMSGVFGSGNMGGKSVTTSDEGGK